MAYLCSLRTPNIQVKCFMFAWTIYILFVLNRAWKHYSLKIMISVYVFSTWSTVDLKRVWDVNNKKWRTCLFNLRYLITHMAHLFSRRTPNVQIKYFVFRWSIYILFVLNTGWIPDSFQMMNIRKSLLNMKHGKTKNAF
jgi:hypothetical protein